MAKAKDNPAVQAVKALWLRQPKVFHGQVLFAITHAGYRVTPADIERWECDYLTPWQRALNGEGTMEKVQKADIALARRAKPKKGE